jgi:hypothetical protein
MILRRDSSSAPYLNKLKLEAMKIARARLVDSPKPNRSPPLPAGT